MNKTSIAQQPKVSSFIPHSQSILQRKCACGNHTTAGGECAECTKKKMGLQRKLAIGASNDPLEQEADRVADRVMGMSVPTAVSGAPPRIQRSTGQTTGDDDIAPPSVGRVLASSSMPLEPALRQEMEQRFGHDFSKVRVHTGRAAEQSARDVNAHAYTVGNNIVFGAGQYSLGTHEGRRLVAHELTHVVQQSSSNGFRVNPGIKKHDLVSNSARKNNIQREPVTTTVATVTIGSVVAKCIIGAIVGALFDAAIQAVLSSWRQRTWQFWRATLNYCSIILSAILGCIAAPVSAFILEGWVTARLGTLGGMAGTLIGKILIFIAKKLVIAIPKTMVGKLAKLGCISPEQAAELGVTQNSEVAA